MRLIGILILFILLIRLAPAVHASSCDAILGSPPTTLEGLEQSMRFSIYELASLRIKIDTMKGKTDAVSISMAEWLEGDFQTKRTEIVNYILKTNLMTEKQLDQRLRDQVEIVQARQQIIDERIREIKNDLTDAINIHTPDGTQGFFHRIEPGEFMMGPPDDKHPKEIAKPFELMTTKVTQIIWQKVAELANARLKGRKWIEPRPAPPKISRDVLPVVGVSYYDVEEWFAALNELSEKNIPGLTEIFPQHEAGDTYRLPTETEWEFVLRGRGTYNDLYHWGNDESKEELYGWPREGDPLLKPPALKLPLLIDSAAFYDMVGGTYEWVIADALDWKKPWHTGQDDHVLRGGGLKSHERYAFMDPANGPEHVGFRMAKNPRESRL